MALGKLDRPAADVAEPARRQGFADLPIPAAHAVAAGQRPLLHRDPFDRVLIAQARVEGYALVTADEAIAAYEGPILRC